jgi:hypothetical protein
MEDSTMTALRRVFGDKAGPNALGILVPPGARTTLVVRPRALPWDLLPVTPSVDVIRFREFSAAEAEALAEGFARSLEEQASRSEDGCEAIRAPGSPGFCVRAIVGTFHLIACPRLPGQPYRPMVWTEFDVASDAAAVVRKVFFPPDGSRQEIYFNSRHFTRS